jgi:hypothetical protein
MFVNVILIVNMWLYMKSVYIYMNSVIFSVNVRNLQKIVFCNC